MDYLEDQEWRSVQQESDVIPDGDHTQDSDVNQDLAPSVKAKLSPMADEMINVMATSAYWLWLFALSFSL